MLGFIVFSGFITAPLAPWLRPIFKARVGWVISLLPALITAYLASQLPSIASGQIIIHEWQWVPALGLSLAFRLDGLSLLFALLISGIGTLVVIYAGAYLKGHPDLGRFYIYLLVFMAAMLGVALSDNLLALFIFWELTSISSYLLIGFSHDQAESRAGALKALLITGMGGLAMMAGFILLGHIAGTNRISELPSDLAGAALYTPMLLLVLLGAFTKSAQWPFHIWLPDAMQAPTPVSAYLHSATMVKAGVYLLARLSPALSDGLLWSYVVTAVGLITMVAGGILALKQTDLKAILAYTTIGWLGTLVLLLGWGGHYAVEAATVGILAHALYKGALFMIAGGIDHETGTRDIGLLSGLRRVMPISALFTAVAAASMAGIPLLFGFVAKELLLEGILHHSFAAIIGWVAIVAVVLASLINVAVGLRLAIGLFWGPLRYPNHEENHIHDPYPGMLLGPAVLAGLTLLFGLWPAAVNGLISQASSQVFGESLAVSLKLWHGITTPLLLSVAAIVLGALLYGVYGPAATFVARFLPSLFNNIYNMALAGLTSGTERFARILQNGLLRYYLGVILISASTIVGFAIFRYRTDLFNGFTPTIPQAYEVVVGLIIIVTAVLMPYAEERLKAIAWLAIIGLMVSLLFVLFSAPDLALTQLLVETLMIIVLLLVFHFLPKFFIEERTTRAAQVRDILLSLVVGASAFALVMVAVSAPPPASQSLAEYFVAHSYTLAHGRNVVNVILVDFRAADTLGEITVLVIAAIGIFALLRGRLDKVD